MGGIGQITGEIAETVKEVASDVKDSFGEAIEQGAQASSSSPLTPQQQQQKQQEDQQKEIDRQKQLNYTRGWLKNVADEQQKVRMQNEQKEKQRLQVQKQEEQVSEMKKEEKKKVNPALANIGKAEIKGGVGG